MGKKQLEEQLEALKDENRLLRNKLRLALGSSANGATIIASPDDATTNNFVSISGLSEGVLRVDSSGEVVYANTRLCDLLGSSKQACQGAKLREIDNLPWAPNVFETLLTDARQGGQKIEFETFREDPATGSNEHFVFLATIEQDVGQVIVRDVSNERRIRDHFARHVGTQVLEKVLTQGINTLDHERLMVSVVFADLRGFTSTSRNKPPEEVAAMLNDCFEVAFEVIDHFQGTIDKIVGDEVMALFGAPLSQASDPYRAVLCAIEMQRAHEALRQRYLAQGREMPHLGIGINTGVVVAGNIGSGRRVDYTVIGEEVNLASRLCSAAQANQILVSRNTVDAVGVYVSDYPHEAAEVLRLKRAGEVEAKGYPEPVKVYRALWSETDSQV